MSSSTAPPDGGPKPFDIVSTYNDLLRSDPDLTMPIAAIEALVLLLTHSPSSTISETFDLLGKSADLLKRSIPNPIGLSAGTDLFERYLTATLQRPGQLGPAGDFNAIRAHLLTNGRLFIQRAKESRDKIASFGRGFVREGSTVLTNGGSRVVSALLRKAAGEPGEGGVPGIQFRAIYVTPSAHHEDPKEPGVEPEGMSTVRALRAKGVPVATIPEAAVAYALGMSDMVIVGAEGVVENGGIISRMGTYQMAILAKSMGKPFYVVAESHKFVRLYPLNQYDLPVKQLVVDFKTANDEPAKSTDSNATEQPTNAKPEHLNSLLSGETLANQATGRPLSRDAVDFTPPDLISALITESGVLTSSAVSEELIKIWF